MQRALTGIQPTGTPHLGNYLGMIRPALALVERYESYCRLNVLVDSGVAGRALVADLLKVFFDHNLHGQLDDYGGDGGVVVFGWSKASKIGKTFYDEGRVDLQVGNGSHTMTIDDDTDKEYSFSYRSI